MSSDLKALEDLNRGYVSAAERSDMRWYDEHLAEDFMASNPDGSIADRRVPRAHFVNSNPDGSLSDRAAFLAFIAKPPPISGLRSEDVLVRILGTSRSCMGARSTRTPKAILRKAGIPTSMRAAAGAGSA